MLCHLINNNDFSHRYAHTNVYKSVEVTCIFSRLRTRPYYKCHNMETMGRGCRIAGFGLFDTVWSHPILRVERNLESKGDFLCFVDTASLYNLL